jgi:uncharacterized membrane protein
VSEDDDRKSTRKLARRRLALEAFVLFVFAWIAAILLAFLRPEPMASSANFGGFQVIGSTLRTALECFVFGYVLSRFFKQFKTGCALVIILFLTYLIWSGRHREKRVGVEACGRISVLAYRREPSLVAQL